MTSLQRTSTSPSALRAAGRTGVRGPLPTGPLRLLVGGLLLLLAPAATAQVSGFNVTNIKEVGSFDLNSDRFPNTGASSTRRINIADCEAYLGQEITVEMSLALSGDSKFAVKLEGPGHTCANDVTISATSCIYLDTTDKDTTDTNFTVTIDMDQLMFGTGVPNCDNMEDDEAIIYIVAESTLDSTTSTSTVEFEIDLDPPSAPEVTEAGSGDVRISVTWDDSSNDANKDRTFKVYWSVDPIDETNKASAFSEEIGQATTFDIEDNISNGITYYVAVTAIDLAENESSLSNVQSVVPEPSTDFWEAYQANGGSDTGGFCFIATVSYGTSMANELGTLRAFRDTVLLPTESGRQFVAEYYMWGRFAAAWIADKPGLKWVTRVLLTPLVWFAELALATSFGWALVFFGLGMAAMFATTRRLWRWRRSLRQAVVPAASLVEGTS